MQASTLHIPQRLDGESFKAYQLRRIESQRAVAAIVNPVGRGGTPRTLRNPAKNERRAAIAQYGRRQWLKREKAYRASERVTP